ncbi:serpin B6-like isoform X2 [Anthonomus grandis grandis]|uniref:serpin B6-like isoform X2 n=1 Tax=Anthonomus grandis grandis TaxID=2921223 RepID=UPI0021662A33|nr:serpin B6-like isoform X2 [Anthonomus grandis grandis]XP_050315387.1 serpin B6-like isoform X2 [Anthonomus grandis grandis]
MGLKRAFTEQADFGDMIKNEALQISKVVQKAFIEVNEEGSEAAAATGIRIMKRSISFSQVFTVDHPFLMVLKRHANILFFGRVGSVRGDIDSHRHEEL